MQVTVGSTITVENPSQELIQWCKENLIISNPEYAKKLRMHFWLGNTPKELCLYETNGDSVILPYGVLRDILPMISSAKAYRAFTERKTVNFDCSVPLYDYQQVAVEAMKNQKYGILQSPAGSGKGLPLSAKIYTPNGFVRNGDLTVGDEVLNAYGGISRVSAIYDRGKQFCYKFTFTDDSEVICDKDHLWQVRNTRKGKSQWQVLSAESLYQKGVLDSSGNRQWEIPIAKPVRFDSRKVTIDPWLLGVLLGDGSFCGNEVSISNTESDILQKVASMVKGNVYHRKERVSMIICDKGSLKYRLKDYGLQGLHSWEKFIPKEYRYNSADIRLKVLQGLIDSDGSVCGSQVTITSTSRQLMEDCLEIVQSLGGTGKISTRHTKYTYKGETKEGRESYRLTLKLYEFDAFTSIKHKRNSTPRTTYKCAYRRIKAIAITAPRETRCISVDSNDELYITDGLVVTHNTQMGIALMADLGLKTLWLTHTKDLLNQSKERAEQYMSSDLIGTITEGKVNIGNGVTFATIQTMCKLDLAQYRDYWDCIITDEVHRVSGSPTAVTQYQKVLNSLSARHKYGLSATVHRSDGMIKATYALVGEVAYKVPEEAVAERVMKVGIKPCFTEIRLSRECLNTDGTLNYAKLITYLTENTARNQLIADSIEQRPSLILSDRLNHLETLISLLPVDMQKDAVMISGKMTTKKGKAEREQALEDMRSGKKKYLFATYSLAKEGLDIPCLERLYMATPIKDYTVVTQSIGRIARTCEGKAAPVCYDFVDDTGYLVKAHKRRCSIYRKNICYFVE